MGAAPLIEDGDLLLAESAAIVEYIIVKHGGGRLKLGPEHPAYPSFLYRFHFSNRNLQPGIGRLMMLSRIKLPVDHPVQASVQGRLDRLMSLVRETAWRGSLPGRPRVHRGRHHELFSLTTMRLFQPFDRTPFPNIRAYLQRIGERPAYRNAMAKGDPDLTPMLI